MKLYKVNDTAIFLEVSGRDATRYLNARLTNDIKRLIPLNYCQAAALNPQGRTEGFFNIYKLEDGREQRYFMLCQGGDSEKVVAALKRYIVADRVNVTDLSKSYCIIHVYDRNLCLSNNETAALSGSQFAYSSGLLIALAQHSKIPGIDIIVENSGKSEILARLEGESYIRIDEVQAELLRIKAGIPAYPSELNEHSLFAEAKISTAISFNKGCYCGQEVMEKVDSYGRLPRELKMISFPEIKNLQPGDEVDGLEVMSVAFDQADKHTYCFARIKT